uniref:Uncharacterized protein n=1 Tax=Rhizophora mucronata TaxID=61149 RepID=A0A2P2Q780_RHIMU
MQICIGLLFAIFSQKPLTLEISMNCCSLVLHFH